MRIATNTTSFNIWTSYTKNLGNLQGAMGKLSTGTITNTDDPAGVGIADRMAAQISSTEQARKNGENTVSLFQTADSWLSQVNDDLSRMKQLGVEAKGITSDDDNANLQTEYKSLQEEITRITSRYTAAAKFNGLYLFRGGSGVAVVTGDGVKTDSKINVQIGADIDQTLKLDLKNLQVTNTEVIGTVHTYSYGTGAVTTLTSAERLAAAKAVFQTYRQSAIDFNLLQGDTLADATANVDAGIDSLANSVASGTPQGDTYGGGAQTAYGDMIAATGYVYSDTVNVLLFGQELGTGHDWSNGDTSSIYSNAEAAYAKTTSGGANNAVIGSTHNAVHWSSIIDVNLTSVSSKNVVGSLDSAINFIASARASMGAQQSRVEKTDDALLTYQDNLESAKSKVSDIDMAQETTKYSTYNVLTQSANAMLAQANQLPSSMVLQLIQG